MSFTYSLGSTNAQTAAIAKTRLEIGDMVEGNGVLPSGGNLQDEEIAYYLGSTNDVAAAVASLAGILSRHWATAADVSVGPRRESLSQVSARWATVTAGDGGVSFVAQMGRVDGYTPNA